MQHAIDPMEQANLFYAAVCVLFLVVFGEASTAKLREREVPEWFLNQFKDTWLSKFPLRAQYRLIMVLELAVAGLFVAAIATGEVWNDGARPLMGYGLLLASTVFSMLCFGQRVSFDFTGAASSFFYSALTLLLWFALSLA